MREIQIRSNAGGRDRARRLEFARMLEGEIVRGIQICSNPREEIDHEDSNLLECERRDRAGDSNSLECERKRSHGNIQICSNMGGRNSAGDSTAGWRVDAGD